MNKHIKNKISVGIAAMIMAFSLIAPVAANACDDRNADDKMFNSYRYVVGDGVRLRSKPHSQSDSIVLGLMYYGEGVLLCKVLSYIPGEDYFHVRRISPDMKGYMQYAYFNHL